MSVDETLQRINDMICLNYDHITTKDRLNIYKNTENKSYVSIDQINHIIKSINHNNIKSNIEYMDNMNNKSKYNLLYYLEKNVNHIKETITKINHNITNYHIDYRLKCDQQNLMEKLIDKEYQILKEKYCNLIKLSYEQSYSNKDECDKLEKERFNESINKIKKLKDDYIKTPELTMNNDEDIRASIRLSIYNEQPYSVAKANNINTIQHIQNRLEQTSHFILNHTKDNYDMKLKYPIRRLEERNRISLWRRKLINQLENEYYNNLLAIEDDYLQLVEYLTNEVLELQEEHTIINNYKRLLKASKTMNSDNSNEIKAFKQVYKVKIGSRINELSKFSEMNEVDIYYMLLDLYNISNNKNRTNNDKMLNRY